jgi:hypothetical protein
MCEEGWISGKKAVIGTPKNRAMTKRSAQDKLVDAILPTGVLSQSKSTLIQ